MVEDSTVITFIWVGVVVYIFVAYFFKKYASLIENKSSKIELKAEMLKYKY